MNPMKAIRAKCLDCNGNSYEVRLCPCEDCALWPFRLGKNPYRKTRSLTDEQRKAAAERLKNVRKGVQV